MFVVLTLFLCIFLALVPNVLYLVCYIIALPFHYHLPYRFFGYTAITLVVVCASLLLYGNLIGRFLHQVKQVNYVNADVPNAFVGYRIVHISDLHLDSWKGHSRQLEKRINEINNLNPDLICFTGDLVSMSANEIEPNIEILKKLKAKDGVVSVLGNHDYMPYSRISAEQRNEAIESVVRSQRNDLGWQLLLNEHVMLHLGTDSIKIIGCENHSVGAHSVVQRGNLARAMGEPQMAGFQVLLTHDPSHWRHEVLEKTPIQLTLSGHTHAMQFRIFGWTPSRWLYPECDGLYTENNQTLYVNIGLGGTAPFRIGAIPEITLITLAK
ncbi:MAG: metallophosphoesterase [Salinivirgaceae bacterium]|nr:metallophosphoesterase [Salinivirgaceae bacterium]